MMHRWSISFFYRPFRYFAHRCFLVNTEWIKSIEWIESNFVWKKISWNVLIFIFTSCYRFHKCKGSAIYTLKIMVMIVCFEIRNFYYVLSDCSMMSWIKVNQKMEKAEGKWEIKTIHFPDGFSGEIQWNIQILTNKIVIFSGLKLQSSRLGCERSERYCEVHELVGLIANCDDFRIRICYSARLVFFSCHIVYYVFLGVLIVGSWHVHWTYYIDLIILELDVAFVHVYNMVRIVDTESETMRYN